MAQNDGMILMLVLMFFAAWTGFTGVLNLMSAGQITWDNIAGATGSVPGQVQYIVSPVEAVTNQNYTNTAGYDANLTFSQSNWLISYGTWTQSSAGLTLTATGGILSASPLMLLDNIVPDSNGHYVVSYTIDNVPNQPYAVYARYQTEPNNIIVLFKSDGVHVRNDKPFGASALGDIFFYPFPNAQTTIPGGSIITTDYVPGEGVLAVFQDGNMLFSVSGMTGKIYQGGSVIYYGALSSESVGIVLKSTDATRAAASSNGSANGGIWSGLANLITGIVPGGQAIVQFFAIIGAAIGLTSDPVIPFAVWAIIGIPQIAFLIYLGLKIARGVS